MTFLDPTVGSVILGDAGNDALTLSGPATLVGFSHGLYRDNPTTAVATAMTMTMTTPGNGVTISGAIGEAVAGSGIIKAGAGKLTLSGNNTYSGLTTVSAGVLELGMSAQSPVLARGGADIRAGQDRLRLHRLRSGIDHPGVVGGQLSRRAVERGPVPLFYRQRHLRLGLDRRR